MGSDTLFGMIGVLMILAGLWKIFVKAGEPGWAAVIPFYNAYVLFKITWGNGWWCVACLIPVANLVLLAIAFWKLSRAFGYGAVMALGLVLLTPVFLLVLGFGKEPYLGVPEKMWNRL